MHLTIVGGGVAGLVAAVEAAERGLSARLYEAHATLRGRTRTSPAPYVAHEASRVFYSDGPTWAWLRDRRPLAVVDPAFWEHTPPAISPTPRASTSSGPKVPARPGCSTCRIPSPHATTSRPVTAKLAIWIHPSSPRLSRLSGWRRRSNPRRVRT